MSGATAGAMRLIVSTLVTVATASPNPALTQQPSGASDELTQAILRYAFRYDGGNVRLIPGRVPEDLAPNYYAPPGTRVLATIISASAAVILAATSAPADSMRAEYTRALQPRGWTPWEGPDRGGFVASTANTPLIFCRNGAQLHVTHRRRAAPPHDLQLEYREGGGMCEARPVAERMEFVGINRPRFPTLRSPDSPPDRPTSRCFSGAPSGARGSMGTGTTVSTDLSAAELLEYYGRQLEASGWRPPGAGTGVAVISRTWTRPDSTGASEVTLEITEMRPGTRCYNVQMRMTR